jgi:hypothetical protein
VSLITPTRIVVVGGGGREHALAWKLRQSPRLGVNGRRRSRQQAIALEPRVRCAGRGSARSAAVVAVAGWWPPSSSSSGRRRRSPPA